MKKVRPEKKFYRQFVGKKGVSFEVSAGESDLWIYLPGIFSFSENLKKVILEYLILLRKQLEAYIKENPDFYSSLVPVKVDDLLLPEIVKTMLNASQKVGVGPMAGVAGAINYFVGKKLEGLGFSQYIIENGGDVLVFSKERRVLKLYTGNSKIDETIGLRIPEGKWGVCSSSSKIGHSLSFGNTTIATVVAEDVVIADCAATFLANSRTFEESVEKAEILIGEKKIAGVFCVIGDKIVVNGNLEMVRIV
ncbi:UPF0280 family protein [Desulfurobacterium sp.]|uniref:UPF0280 family protein n=1 Tax=Desulfurobacterium sp. TaxID=2004706 RepID=UPI0026094ED6|nr:UPF0280 family protein [Desulfurobacterium sp.]